MNRPEKQAQEWRMGNSNFRRVDLSVIEYVLECWGTRQAQEWRMHGQQLWRVDLCVRVC